MSMVDPSIDYLANLSGQQIYISYSDGETGPGNDKTRESAAGKRSKRLR